MMDDVIIRAAQIVGQFFVSDIYAYYEDSYKGSLGKVQVECLDYLHRKKTAYVSELAERLNISKQHASKIVSRLETLDYAQKTADPSDGRMTRYSLTSTGIAFVEEHILLSNDHLLARISMLQDADRTALLDALLKAAEALEHLDQSST